MFPALHHMSPKGPDIGDPQVPAKDPAINDLPGGKIRPQRIGQGHKIRICTRCDLRLRN